MNNSDQQLAHSIKLKFGTPPDEPNAIQVAQIKTDIQALIQKGVTPTLIDWAEIVKRYCPDAGRYGYKGADTSDLITLLQLATKK